MIEFDLGRKVAFDESLVRTLRAKARARRGTDATADNSISGDRPQFKADEFLGPTGCKSAYKLRLEAPGEKTEGPGVCGAFSVAGAGFEPATSEL